MLRAGLALLVVFVATGVEARTKDRAACEAAHLRAQELRADAKLLDAREQLYLCAAEECPGIIQEDCAGWLTELDKNVPTLIPAAKTEDGRELVDVRVLVGDRLLTERLDGRPIEIDPGAYTLRFEAGGTEPVTLKIVARAGVKNRIVEATFPSDPAETAESSPPLEFWILAGVGTAAFVSFGTFALLGQKQYSDLEADCAPKCDPGDSDSVRTKFLIADVSLGVAVLAGAGAAYFYFSRPKTRVGVAPVSGGGLATLETRF